MKQLINLYDALRNIRYPLVLACFTLILSFLSSLPVQSSLHNFFGHSVTADELFPGIRFAPFMQWFFEYINSASWNTTLYVFIFSAILLFLFRVIFSTGYLYEMYMFNQVRGKILYTISHGVRNLIHVITAFPLWFLLSAMLVYGWYRIGQWGISYLIQKGRDDLFLQASGIVGAGMVGLLLCMGILWDITKLESMRKGFFPLFAGVRAFFFPFLHFPTLLIWFFFYTVIPMALFFGNIQAQHILLTLPFPYQFIEYAFSLILIPLIGAVFKIGLWRAIGKYYRLQDGIMARPEGLEPPTW